MSGGPTGWTPEPAPGSPGRVRRPCPPLRGATILGRDAGAAGPCGGDHEQRRGRRPGPSGDDPLRPAGGRQPDRWQAPPGGTSGAGATAAGTSSAEPPHSGSRASARPRTAPRPTDRPLRPAPYGQRTVRQAPYGQAPYGTGPSQPYGQQPQQYGPRRAQQPYGQAQYAGPPSRPVRPGPRTASPRTASRRTARALRPVLRPAAAGPTRSGDHRRACSGWSSALSGCW